MTCPFDIIWGPWRIGGRSASNWLLSCVWIVYTKYKCCLDNRFMNFCVSFVRFLLSRGQEGNSDPVIGRAIKRKLVVIMWYTFFVLLCFLSCFVLISFHLLFCFRFPSFSFYSRTRREIRSRYWARIKAVFDCAHHICFANRLFADWVLDGGSGYPPRCP